MRSLQAERLGQTVLQVLYVSGGQLSAVARGGAGGGGGYNYGGNKSINRLEVTTDQCSAVDLDFFY